MTATEEYGWGSHRFRAAGIASAILAVLVGGSIVRQEGTAALSTRTLWGVVGLVAAFTFLVTAFVKSRHYRAEPGSAEEASLARRNRIATVVLLVIVTLSLVLLRP